MMRQFWRWLGRFAFPSLLLQRLDKAERQEAILEEQLAEANEKISKLQKDNAGLFYAAKKTIDDKIAAQVRIQVRIQEMESELAKARKERDQVRASLEKLIMGRLVFLQNLRDDFVKIGSNLFEQCSWLQKEKELFYASSVKEDGRKDHHQQVDHDHGDRDQGGSSGNRDRGAEVGGGQPGGGGQG